MPKWLIDCLIATVVTVFITVCFSVLHPDAPGWASSLLFFIVFQIILIRGDIDSLKKSR